MQNLLEQTLHLVDEAEIFQQNTLQNLVCFDNNRLESVETCENIGTALRVIKDGRLGQIATADLSAPQELAQRAAEIAAYGDVVKYHFPSQGKYPQLALADSAVRQQSAEEMIACGQELIAILREVHPDLLAMCSIVNDHTRIALLNSAGLNHAYERTCQSLMIGAKLTEPNNILQIFKCVKARHLIPNAVAIAQECAAEFQLARKTVPLRSGKYPVIFTPAALADVFNGFTAGVNGAQVARQLSPLCGKIGEQVLDQRVTIIDDGLHPEGTLTAPMDDEGIAAQKTMLVENGVLRGYLCNLKAAADLDCPSTGNGLRETALDRAKSYMAGVGLDFTNLILSPGQMSYAQMLANTKLGVEIHHITGILLGNLTNGNFSGNLEVAYKIENGERIGRIKDTMISGNFYQLFRERLIDLSSEQIWTGNFGGETGSFLFPYGYFADIDLSGKE